MQLDSLSTFSESVDTLTLILTLLCLGVTFAIFIVVAFFCFKFHSSKKKQSQYDVQNKKLEVFWTSATLIIFLTFFIWAGTIYQKEMTPPKADYHIYVYAKRWMWKFHHENGFVEINHLHLPKEKNIRFVMVSQDVIHSLFLPEFRIKQDVLPDTYSYMNIRSKKTGDYPLNCAEYCGTFHAKMGGVVTFLEEKNYLALIGKTHSKMNLVSQGKILFDKQGCLSCHQDQTIAPKLNNLTDETFIRESITDPQKIITKGYKPQMPSFKGVFKEEEIRALTEYIKSLRMK